MLKKLVLSTIVAAVAISTCACNNTQVEHREYYDTCVFHEDLKAPGGLLFAEDARYEVGGEWGMLNDGNWYVITLDNNGTSDKTDDTIIDLVPLQ